MPDPAPIDYKALPGSRLGLRFNVGGAASQAYFGPDHLLVLETSGYRDRSQPVAYAEIQAIQAWDHNEQHWWSLGASLPALGFAAVAWSVGGGDWLPLRIIFGVLSGLFWLLLLWNLYSGPACRVRFKVNGEWREQAYLRRWRAARATLDQLLPRLRAAQAGLELAAPAGEAVQGVAAPEAVPGSFEAAQAQRAAEAAQAPAPGVAAVTLRNAAWALYAAAALTALSSVYDLAGVAGWVPMDELSGLLTYTSFAAVAVALALGVRAGRRAIWGALVGIGVAALQLLLTFVASFVLLVGGELAKLPRSDSAMWAIASENPIFQAFIALAALLGLPAALFMAWSAWRLRKP